MEQTKSNSDSKIDPKSSESKPNSNIILDKFLEQSNIEFDNLYTRINNLRKLNLDLEKKLNNNT